jgi:hypothetical protein
MGTGNALLFSVDPQEDTLFRRVTPLAEQVEYLQDRWHELRDAISPTLSARFSVPTSTWIQGSYKYQTLLRPFAKEEFDLDLGFYFEWTGLQKYTAKQIKAGVQSRLAELVSALRDARSLTTPPKERCCRLNYENQFHIDVPVYHLDPPADVRELAREKGTWERSDPKALYKWFRDRIVRTDRAQVRRLICYLKAWARLQLSGDARPSSILLTVLVLDAVYAASFRTDLDDDDALLNALIAVGDRLKQQRVVPNPVNRAEDLNRLSEGGLSTFLNQLDTAIVFVRAATSAADVLTSARHLEWLFAYMVPFPDTIRNPRLREAARATSAVEPEVAVRQTSNDHLMRSERNEAPAVRKNYALDFQVVNATAFPAGSHYSWVVRNAGADAEVVNDLGHSQQGVNKTAVREHAKYNGRQYMDLTIRHNGSVVGFRRIPVDISGDALASPYKKVRYGPR